MKTCIECGKEADAPIEQQSENYPICASCLSKGWTSDPQEVFDAVRNDPLLGNIVNVKLPYISLPDNQEGK